MNHRLQIEMDSSSMRSTASSSAALIVSDDTDVFTILLCNKEMHRFGVKQILGDTVHDVDSAEVSLLHSEMTAVDVGAAFCLAGCDYAPSHYGLRHDHFIESRSTFQKELKDLKAPV